AHVAHREEVGVGVDAHADLHIALAHMPGDGRAYNGPSDGLTLLLDTGLRLRDAGERLLVSRLRRVHLCLDGLELLLALELLLGELPHPLQTRLQLAEGGRRLPLLRLTDAKCSLRLPELILVLLATQIHQGLSLPHEITIIHHHALDRRCDFRVDGDLIGGTDDAGQPLLQWERSLPRLDDLNGGDDARSSLVEIAATTVGPTASRKTKGQSKDQQRLRSG